MEEEIKKWLAGANDYQAGLTLLGKYSDKPSLVAYLGKKQNEETEEKLVYELEKLLSAQPEVEFVSVARIEVFQPQTEESADDDALPVAEEKPIRIKLFNPEEKEEFAADSAADEIPAPGRIKLFQTPKEVQPESLKVGVATHIEVDGQLQSREELLEPIEKEMSKLFTERAILSNSFTEEQTDDERLEISNQIESLTQQISELGKKRDLIHDGQLIEPADEPVEASSNPAKAELQIKRRNLASNVTKAKKAAELAPDDVVKQEKYTKLALEMQELDLQIKLV